MIQFLGVRDAIDGGHAVPAHIVAEILEALDDLEAQRDRGIWGATLRKYIRDSGEWRETLKRYIDHVGMCEGVAFMRPGELEGSGLFSDEQVRMLREVDAELMEEQKP